MWLLRVARPSVVATYAYVNPLVAVFVGASFGGEAVTANVGLATVLIVGAVVLIAFRRRAPGPERVKRDHVVNRDDEAEPAIAPVKARLAECEG